MHLRFVEPCGISAFCGTELHWHENPFGLISWLDMERFSAEQFYAISCSLEELKCRWESKGITLVQGEHVDNFAKMFHEIGQKCESIGLIYSRKAAERAVADMKGNPAEQIKFHLRALAESIKSEMEEHLFLWVPDRRSEWYSKDAESILGQQCCDRFKSIQRDTEEAAKCYAVGRFTASAFHLTRATEAGVKALAKAINYQPPNDNWTLVFRQMGNEFKLPNNQRPAHWQTHGYFLEEIWADLRAVSKAWRNNIAHLVDVYTEEDAKELLAQIPLFLRHLATKMDENGNLY